MARLRVRVEMNKGRTGVPLEKLASIVAETERFFTMLGNDIRLEGGEWIGLDFSNGSLNFDAEYTREVPESDVRIFNEEFDDVRRGKFPSRASVAARSQYYRIAEPLDRDEELYFGLYRPGIPEPEKFYLSQAEATRLILASPDQQQPVDGVGTIQGVIHSVFFGSDPHFQVRELATGNLIRCNYTMDSEYEALIHALQSKHAVIHVYGDERINLVTRKVERITVHRLDVAETMSESEFDNFFGCAPSLTGNETTQQFIDRIRGRNEPA